MCKSLPHVGGYDIAGEGHLTTMDRCVEEAVDWLVNGSEPARDDYCKQPIVG